MSYVICEPCIGTKDTACQQVCPVNCIHEHHTRRRLYIDPAACVQCGRCVEACPVSAIFVQAEVPTEWQKYIIKEAVPEVGT